MRRRLPDPTGGGEGPHDGRRVRFDEVLPEVAFQPDAPGCSTYSCTFEPPGFYHLVATWNELALELGFEVGRVGPIDGPMAPPKASAQ